MFRAAIEYVSAHPAEFRLALLGHVRLCACALSAALLIAVPVGWRSASGSRIAAAFAGFCGMVRVVPSLALLFLAIPVFGMGWLSAVVALTVLAVPPILLHTEAGLRSVPAAALEAADAMGMSAFSKAVRVRVPLAFPVILSGLRAATVETIAGAALAAFIGAGGLGVFITRGFAMYEYSILLAGALPIAVLALMAEGLLAALQHWFEPPA